MSLEAIRYKEGDFSILDQLLLPLESTYVPVKNTEDGWNAIRKMQVRGAPAIGIVACLSLAVELRDKPFDDAAKVIGYVTDRMSYLVTSRPTAVNIQDAMSKLQQLMKIWNNELNGSVAIKERIISWLEKQQKDDIEINKTMGEHGSKHLLQNLDEKPVTVLTHCNTGSLATGGYGTALGVVRSLFEKNKLVHCYCTETRPYNQGSRLTAYELVQDKIPGTLICDSMVSMLMKEKKISAVYVGADRVVANGDTANKIGTYQIAIIAKHFGIPFYVVAPSTSIDLTLRKGEDIPIEERSNIEMIQVKDVQIAPSDINCWNPAFDVTPANLITGGIVTEYGVFSPQELESQLTLCKAK